MDIRVIIWISGSLYGYQGHYMDIRVIISLIGESCNFDVFGTP